MYPLIEKEMGSEKRSETRKIIDDYYSVVHQFKVRNMSPWGLGILVKEDSAALRRLEVGDVLEMKYNPAKPLGSAEYLRTEIRHITRLDQGRFKGHYLVGLLILDKTDG
jgi:hypothetical protein